MKLFPKKRKHSFLFLIGLTVLVCVGIKLVSKIFIVQMPIEFFSSNNNYNNTYTQTVNMPLTNPYDCGNFCGPTSRCAITGHQCTADLDCPGCTPPSQSIPGVTGSSIRGNNDAGKLGVGDAVSYSSLTTDMGTQSKLYDTATSNLGPMHPNLGENLWIKNYEFSMNDFNRRYRPVGLEFIPNYKKTFTLSGEFATTGPLPSNAYL
jgi:hypothetical protein